MQLLYYTGGRKFGKGECANFDYERNVQQIINKKRHKEEGSRRSERKKEERKKVCVDCMSQT